MSDILKVNYKSKFIVKELDKSKFDELVMDEIYKLPDFDKLPVQYQKLVTDSCCNLAFEVMSRPPMMSKIDNQKNPKRLIKQVIQSIYNNLL